MQGLPLLAIHVAQLGAEGWDDVTVGAVVVVEETVDVDTDLVLTETTKEGLKTNRFLKLWK